MEKATSSDQIVQMREIALRMRDLILRQPPQDLLGYIYSHQLLDQLSPAGNTDSDPARERGSLGDRTGENQFLLEYVHAALASAPASKGLKFDEAECAEIYELSSQLQMAAMLYAMASSHESDNKVFGPETADVEFRAKASWVLIRGNRYQVLEEEFYNFVLEPHDDALREAYGVSAKSVAAGFQEIADTVRSGQADAVEVLAQAIEEAQIEPEDQEEHSVDARRVRTDASPPDTVAASRAADDLLRGGICNVSRHTNLPKDLLDDLSFHRGEDEEFFFDEPLSSTPFQTLPARKKPLIKLDESYYAVDPCFARDAGYRALLFNLLRRSPGYKKKFESGQKSMSEAAFFQILDDHLDGAKVNQEVWYKNPKTGQWVENDTLVRIDDALFLIEAKAGAAATIASPASDFPRHVQSIQDLIVKAYQQCARFFEYLNSADEVPIYERRDGRYIECDRLRIADFRLLFPIGLTIESFTPFSTMCKELEEIKPILDRYAFLSLSIDDLFVLRRFLPTMGAFSHYLDVRQAVASIKGVELFDEFDHLGAYIDKNRFDQVILAQQAEGNPDKIVWEGMSKTVDQHFVGEEWNRHAPAGQEYPDEVLGLLSALNRARAPGWLAAESVIRDYDEKGRNDLTEILQSLRVTLGQYNHRYFQLTGDQSIFIWLQREGSVVDRGLVEKKASAAALASSTNKMIGVIVFASPDQGYDTAVPFPVQIPAARNSENSALYEEAERMRQPRRQTALTGAKQAKKQVKKLGRNQLCWCGSGIKFKKCHGR